VYAKKDQGLFALSKLVERTEEGPMHFSMEHTFGSSLTEKVNRPSRRPGDEQRRGRRTRKESGRHLRLGPS